MGLVIGTGPTPVGNPETAQLTAPVNPPVSVIVIVSVPLAPGATARLVGETKTAKPVVPTVTVTVVEAV